MKKHTIKTSLLLGLLMIGFSVSSLPQVFANEWGIFTELALSEDSPRKRWVEIFVLQDTNISGSNMEHRHNLAGDNFEPVITFPSLKVTAGDYIIVELDHTSTQTYTTESWGYVFYSTYPSAGSSANDQPYNTRGGFRLTASNGKTWIDYVFFNREGGDTWGANLQSQYDYAVSTGQWTPAAEAGWGEADYIENVAEYERDTDGMSLQRENNLSMGSPLDYNKATDWKFAATTQGSGYFETPDVENIVQVDNSPFFPHGDSTPEETMISIKNPADNARYATVTIYNVSGYSVRKFLRYEEIVANQKMTFLWDGKDDYGDILPMGVYIVHMRLEPGDVGSVEEARATVVLGRRF